MTWYGGINSSWKIEISRKRGENQCLVKTSARFRPWLRSMKVLFVAKNDCHSTSSLFLFGYWKLRLANPEYESRRFAVFKLIFHEIYFHKKLNRYVYEWICLWQVKELDKIMLASSRIDRSSKLLPFSQYIFLQIWKRFTNYSGWLWEGKVAYS